MDNKELFDQVKKLNLPIGKYALFGSAPMAIREIRDCRDIDVIVTQDLWDECSKKPEYKLTRDENGLDCLVSGNVELWNVWSPGEWDLNKIINEAEVIDGLPFVKLEYVVAWKKIYNREKDLNDIKLINDYLEKMR